MMLRLDGCMKIKCHLGVCLRFQHTPFSQRKSEAGSGVKQHLSRSMIVDRKKTDVDRYQYIKAIILL